MEDSFDLIASCIDKIYNDEEIWEGKDSSKRELRDFIDQLSSKQFKKLKNSLRLCQNFLIPQRLLILIQKLKVK